MNIYTLEKDKESGWWIMEAGFSLAYCRKKEDAERIMNLLRAAI